MKKICAVVSVLLLGFTMWGCVQPASAASQEQIFLPIASGPSGGVYYMVGAALSKVIHDFDPDITSNAEATGATNENLLLVHNGEATLAMGMCDDIEAAYKGEREYEGKSPMDDIRIVMAGYNQAFHVIVPVDSDIKVLADLKGKRISCGPPGAVYFVPKFIEATTGYKKDVDYTAQHLGHDQAADALQNGDIDCIIAAQGIPSGAYSSLSETMPVRFLPVTKEDMQKILTAMPAWLESKIPAGSYKGITEDVYVPSIPIWLFTSANVPENDVYRLTKAILGSRSELAAIHPSAGEFNIDNAKVNVTMPFHPGAEKALNEEK